MLRVGRYSGMTGEKLDKAPQPRHDAPPATDVLNIAGDLVPELDAVMLELLERGKHERVMILAGTEGGKAAGRTR